jgi:hypothetical protein
VLCCCCGGQYTADGQAGRQSGSQSLDSARVDLEICVDGAGWLAREWQWLSS